VQAAELSGPEGERTQTALREADAQFLEGLGTLTLAMAKVEKTDHRRPDAGVLRQAVPDFQNAASLITRSTAVLRNLGPRTPGTLKAEARHTAKVLTDLAKSVETMAQAMSQGKYPTAGSCEKSADLLREVYTKMARSARIVRS
jgi:hypothetical protein